MIMIAESMALYGEYWDIATQLDYALGEAYSVRSEIQAAPCYLFGG